MKEYFDKDGILNMCKNCRAVMNPNNHDDWVIITLWYNDPPENTNFVICPLCPKK